MKFVSVDPHSEEQLCSLENLFKAVPGYMERVYGRPGCKADARITFTVVPPRKNLSEKFIFAFYDGADMIACMDLIRGYPTANVAFIGLLIVDESRQRQGIGQKLFAQAESIVSRWSGVNKLRLAVAEPNAGAVGFWQRMGFVLTGERSQATEHDRVLDCMMLEKNFVSTRTRYSMRRSLYRHSPAASHLPVRQIVAADASALGRLMEASYRNTIDDEGENITQFVAEMHATIDGVWGAFIPEASFCIEQNGTIIAATMVTLWKERPLLAQCMTDPNHRDRGAATNLIHRSINALFESGWTDLTLGVTRGNDKAERLYQRLGFAEIPSS